MQTIVRADTMGMGTSTVYSTKRRFVEGGVEVALSPYVDTEYVARMVDVLDLYSEPPGPRRPVVCFDETPVQLIGETRTPWPAQAGKPAQSTMKIGATVPRICSFLDVRSITVLP